MKCLVFVFVLVLLFTCSAPYQIILWQTNALQTYLPTATQVHVVSQYDSEKVLRLTVSIYNPSDDEVEITDILLADREGYILFPLSPEGVAYSYLGSPPPDFPPPPPRRSSKRFVVSGYVREHPRGYYSGEFEIQEQETDGSGSLLRGYLAAAAYSRAEYVRNFAETVRAVETASFRSDRIPAGRKVAGRLYYHEPVLRCPLSLSVSIKGVNSDQKASFNFAIKPGP